MQKEREAIREAEGSCVSNCGLYFMFRFGGDY